MVPFGDAVIATEDTVIGVEVIFEVIRVLTKSSFYSVTQLCEELFTPAS